MTSINIPLGKSEINFEIPEKNLMGIYEPKSMPALSNPLSEIKRAISNPIGSKPLYELALGKRQVVIVVTDITRPSPDHLMLPVIINELERAGIEANNIAILVATGLHRPNTEKELAQKLGGETVNRVKVINHIANDKSNLGYLGYTSFGCPVLINRRILEADLVISTGIIEPHFFAGFSGGRKSIAIGAAGEETIKFQHQPSVFDHPNTRLGNLDGNIFHENGMEIAEMAGLNFIINAVLNNDGDIVAIVAGNFKDAFYKGVNLARALYEVEINQQADIVIAGVGFPKDTNLYQATRGASAVVLSQFPSVRKGGLIITPAQTEEGAGEGLGERRFYEIMKGTNNIQQLIKQIRNSGYPAGGQRAYLLALTLNHANLIITNSQTPGIVEEMHMKALPDINIALKYGLEKYGNDARVIILPHSIQVITTQKKRGEGCV